MRLQSVLPLMIFLAASLPSQTGKAGTTKPSAEKTSAKPKDGTPAHRHEIEKRTLKMRNAMRKGQVRHYNVHVQVHLKNSNKLQGVVKDGRFVEVHNGLDFVAADRSDRSAGLRVWYTAGAKGFIFVPYTDIASYKIGRTLSEAQVRTLEQELAAKREAVEDKYRQIVAAKKIVKPSQSAPGGAVVSPTDLPVVTDEQAAMLKEFPVAEGWGEAKIASLKLRRVTLGVFPTEKEKKFEDIYAEWEEALTAQLKLDAARSELQPTGNTGTPRRPGGSSTPTQPPGTGLLPKPPVTSPPPMPGTRKSPQ
ncbi:MAG: hypothetical protein VX951_05275 [Planctomycetota bacterium]|nr:hypothetical protein [Planctomycetota bacterium]